MRSIQKKEEKGEKPLKKMMKKLRKFQTNIKLRWQYVKCLTLMRQLQTMKDEC